MNEKQIVCMGGGGFSRGNLALDKYFLNLTRKKNPKVCFIPTASGDSTSYISIFYEAYIKLGAQVEVLKLFKPIKVDLNEYLNDFDAIYVGGGNTKSMMAVWQFWGLDKALKNAYEKGIICGGLSAGCNAWFEESHSDSTMPNWCVAKGLGVLNGSVCPHFSGENRKNSYFQMIKSREILEGFAFDDGSAGHFINGELKTVISENEKTNGYSVNKDAVKKLNNLVLITV